jgi:hypothetical protein
MHLLSQKSNDSKIIGVTKKEVCNYLDLPNKNRNFYFQELITNLADYIKPLGLQIRFNPINAHWYLSFEESVSDSIKANPFSDKPRLPATLFCIITVAIMHSGIIKVNDVQKLRKKKGIHRDLEDLEHMGYISLKKDKKGVELIRLTPLLGYQINLEKMSLKLALKQKNK